MTGTLKTTLIQNPSSADVNITLGTSGDVTLAKSPVLNGSTSGTLTIAAPAVAGTNTQTLVAATGTLAPLISGTAQASTSGTSIDFTGIPSWVKRITVMFSGVSTSGNSDYLIRLGTSSGFVTTGYTSSAFGNANTIQSSTAGLRLHNSNNSVYISDGAVVLCSVDAATFKWASSGVLAGSTASAYSGGAITLASVLTQIRVTTIIGTDTFDAGTINIMYE